MKKLIFLIVALLSTLVSTAQIVEKQKLEIYDGSSSSPKGMFGYGRNKDMTLQSSQTTNYLRFGSLGMIGFWCGTTADVNDTPHIEFWTNRSLFRHQLIIGNANSVPYLYLKPTTGDYGVIATGENKKLRVGSNEIGFWLDGNVEKTSAPQIKLTNSSFTTGLPLTVDIDGINTVIRTHPDRSVGWFGTTSSHGLEIGTSGVTAGFLSSGRILYWGFNADEVESMIKVNKRHVYGIYVRNGILASDYAMAPVSTWADYVFDDEYDLRPLSDVEDYINENRHLPDVPSSASVAQDGYSQHEMNQILLQKIEELTLYTIEQQKEIESLKNTIKNLTSE